jgi:hypothetical protein
MKDKLNFKKNKYIIIRKAVSKEITNFIYNYFLLKRKVAHTLFTKKYISPYTEIFGIWNDPQVPGTYSHYADIVMETLLMGLHGKMEKETGLKLNPNYSYARVYKKGDILHRHKDRFSCEISTTLNLGGDAEWPIYLDPTGETNKKGIKVLLKPGDMLVYKGNELEHWRECFEGSDCVQVFLHYNNIATKGSDKNIYDQRIHLGLPSYFKNLKE